MPTNPDSVTKFRVLTSTFTAEYGRSSGAQAAMVTRSGTYEFHGSAFWFYRTPRFNANEWENNINGRGKHQFVQNIPGFSASGPIWKNRTFFFTNWQWLRARTSNLYTRNVFTADARFPEIDFYRQDSWKLRRNLTVDLGLRLDAMLRFVH